MCMLLLLLITSVMSNSVRTHRQQPTRLPHPWDLPGNNTGVGCHFLFQCMKVKSENEVSQSCPTLSDPMDCSLPGSSVHGIFPGKSTGVGCHCLLRHMCIHFLFIFFCIHFLKLTLQDEHQLHLYLPRNFQTSPG